MPFEHAQEVKKLMTSLKNDLNESNPSPFANKFFSALHNMLHHFTNSTINNELLVFLELFAAKNEDESTFSREKRYSIANALSKIHRKFNRKNPPDDFFDKNKIIKNKLPTNISKRKERKLWNQYEKYREEISFPMDADEDGLNNYEISLKNYIQLFSPGTVLLLRNEPLFKPLVNACRRLTYLFNTIEDVNTRKQLQGQVNSLLIGCLKTRDYELCDLLMILEEKTKKLQDGFQPLNDPRSTLFYSKCYLITMSLLFLSITLTGLILLEPSIMLKLYEAGVINSWFNGLTIAIGASTSGIFSLAFLKTTHGFFKHYPTFQVAFNDIEQSVNQIETTKKTLT